MVSSVGNQQIRLICKVHITNYLDLGGYAGTLLCSLGWGVWCKPLIWFILHKNVSTISLPLLFRNTSPYHGVSFIRFFQLFSCLSAPLSFFAFLLSNHVIITPFSWTSSRASRDKAFPLMRCSYTHMGMAKYVVSQSGSSLLLRLLFPLLMGRAGLLLMSL